MEGKHTVNPKRLVVAITGASGPILAIRLLETLSHVPTVETHLVISTAAKLTISEETDWSLRRVMALADVTYDDNEIGASIASGSFPTMGMVVIPCSIKTLSAIANSFGANLISRAADVTLKEGRPLLLVVRESPLHLGHLRLMTTAAETGAIIFPPVPPFYAQPQSIDQMVNQIVGRVLRRLGIESDLVFQWQGSQKPAGGE
jgi:flavin prenyltransferase